MNDIARRFNSTDHRLETKIYAAVRHIGTCLMLCALPFSVCQAQESQRQPITVGLGIATTPRYPGAADYHLQPFPLVFASKSVFFIDGLSAGAAIPLGQHIKMGFIVSTVFGRDETDEKRLNGIGDIPTTAAAGGFISFTAGPFETTAKYLQSLHAGYGATMTLSAKYNANIGARDKLSIGEDAVWANGGAMQTYFGISDSQARYSIGGLPAYSLGSGLQRVDTSLTWTHLLTRSLSVDGLLTLSNLLGNAANSPIVEKRNSVFAGGGVAYAF